MKHILVTGKDSYIGISLEKWLGRDNDKYTVDTVDMIGDAWRERDFSKYDVIFHVAGIAHIKETKDNQQLYFKINRDLAFETAQKAKADGVKHFIFLSTMSVYGLESGVIDEKTPLKPVNAYGESKKEAETLIKQLQDDNFHVSIIRPPMVYGKGCKGNYTRLSRLARKVPFFPDIENKRSMIHIDNLTEFVKQLIDNKLPGLFFPQNAEYVNTSMMVKLIAEENGKKIKLIKLFNPLIRVLHISTINKMFDDLIYEKALSDINFSYQIRDFKESIRLTEGMH